MNSRILIALIAGILLICGGGMFVMNQALQTGRQVAQSAQKFVDAEVPRICTQWRIEDLRRAAHPSLFARNPEEAIAKQFADWKAEYGSLEATQGWKTVKFNTNVDGVKDAVAVNLECPARFSKKPGFINVWLIRAGESWQLSGLNVADAATESKK